jgi:hypothetical protein|tara:strand:- start:181 stop:666 length:486 start_codon:yes stop_codon:yes gene_type:complete
MHKKNNINKRNPFIQGLKPFSSSLPNNLKKQLKKGGYNYSNIVDNWVKMVGRNISEMCYPNVVRMGKNMNAGTLVLNVVHGNELDIEYKKQDIIDKINSFFGFNCIKEVKLKIVQEKKEIKKKIMQNQHNLKYTNKLENINNQNLKNSLDKLIEAYNSKND